MSLLKKRLMSIQRVKQQFSLHLHWEKKVACGFQTVPARKPSSRANLSLTWGESVRHAGSGGGWCRGMTCLRSPPVTVATEQTTSCVMSCRTCATTAESAGGLVIVSVTQPVGVNPTYRFSFIITPPRPPVSSQQLHYKVSLAQDWNLRHNLQSALLI